MARIVIATECVTLEAVLAELERELGDVRDQIEGGTCLPVQWWRDAIQSARSSNRFVVGPLAPPAIELLEWFELDYPFDVIATYVITPNKEIAAFAEWAATRADEVRELEKELEVGDRFDEFLDARDSINRPAQMIAFYEHLLKRR